MFMLLNNNYQPGRIENYITNGDLEALYAVLKQNPSLAKKPTSHHVSPLMLSCYFKKPEVTEFLLQYVDEVNLFEAVAAGKYDVVSKLISKYPEAINYYAEDGFTPLGLACYFGQYEIARHLVIQDADINMASINGFNIFPIHSAAAGDHADIAELLIECGADVNVKQAAGVTPLHSAAQNGNVDMLILLLESGADTSLKMDGGKRACDLAREQGFVQIAEALSR
jgi:ankyrin repeat protein